jgi:ribosomal protein S3
MGQKVNPIGLRLSIHRKWNSNWFFDLTNYSKFIYITFNIEKFFKGFLYYYPIKTLLVNCQIIKLATNQLYDFVFFL